MTNFIYDNTTLPYPKEDFGTLPIGADPKKWGRAIDWNTVCQGLVDVQTFCRGAAWLGVQAHSGDPAPAGIDRYLWMRNDGVLMKTIMGTVAEVGSTSSVRTWAAGTYRVNEVVTRGPYMWRATTTTTEDPLLVEGNLGSSADWTPQTTGSSGMVQGGGELLLIDNVGGQATTAYRQSVNASVLGKMLIVDISLSGSADWFHFGVFDATAPQTENNINASGSTFYGVNLNIYDQRIENWIDGVAATNSGYSNANFTNAGPTYTRWYLSMIANGSNWDLTVYRDARVSNTPISGQSANQVEDLAVIAKFSNVARPTYANWRLVVGARTGGLAGIFKCKNAWVRNITSGNWQVLSRLPTGL